MKKITHFSTKDIIPKEMEKSFTYSEIDDACLFKRQKVRVQSIYRELVDQIKKKVDPACDCRILTEERNPIADLSVDILFYLFFYFYCRFCYLSPYRRPAILLHENSDGVFCLTMKVEKSVYDGFPNREELMKKASYLSEICGFSISIRDSNPIVAFSFCLTKKAKSSFFISAFAFAEVAKWISFALASAQHDHDIS